MRDISEELLAKIQKRSQTVYENANPALRIYFSKGLNGELFRVYTIQGADAVEPVDVTVKRTSTLTEPAEAFAVTLRSGVATIWSQPLPYDDQYPWNFEFELGEDITDAAIEFDGYWERDVRSRRFNFVTEDTPWLFFVSGGILYAQKWTGEAVQLATNVSKIAVLRGWLPANGTQENDQGLIVAYVKSDSTLCYRSYCIQASLAKTWETERQVSVFSGDVDNIALFRTNDFRVGFVAEVAGEAWWAITERNWAGMSFPAEVVNLGVHFKDALFTIYEILELEYRTKAETVAIAEVEGFAVFNVYEILDTVMERTLALVEGYIVDERTFVITFNSDVYTWSPEKLASSISVVNASIASIAGNEVTYTTDEDMDELLLEYGFLCDVGCGRFIRVASPKHKELFAGGVVVVKGRVRAHVDTVSIDMSIGTCSFGISDLVQDLEYLAYPYDTVLINVDHAGAELVVTEVSTSPV